MIRKLTIIFTVIAILAGCGSGDSFDGVDKKNDNKGNKHSDAAIDNVDTTLFMQLLKDMMNSINPVEMTAMIQETGHPFSKAYLSDADAIDRYVTAYQKALNLGLFGADLGYISMYEKTSTIMPYLNAIKRLSDDLRIGQFFDFNALKNLAQDNRNLDSLRFLSVNSFNQMSKHLRANNRSEISVLLLTGVWIQALNIAVSVYEETKNEDMAERIGEQKLIINQLAPILKMVAQSENEAEVLSGMVLELQNVYSQVDLKIIPGQLEEVEKDGMITFIQNSKSVVQITPEQLAQISALMKEILKEITK